MFVPELCGCCAWGGVMVDVSVIIPVYNVSRWISKCLDSVLGQSLRNIEVLCYDDGSTDDSVKILQRYAAIDPRIRICQCSHCGTGSIRNKAIEAAAGRFIAFMDSDDLYPEQFTLEKLVRAADEQGVDIAGGYTIGFSDDNYEGWRQRRPTAEYYPEVKGITDYRDFQSLYGFYCYIYRREMILKNGIRFPPLVRFEDPVFFVRAMLTARRFYAINECVYLYRVQHKEVAWSANGYALRKEHIRGATEIVRMANENRLLKLRQFGMSEAVGGVTTFTCYQAVRKEFSELMKNLRVGLSRGEKQWLLHWIVREENLLRRLFVAAEVLGPFDYIEAIVGDLVSGAKKVRG